MRRLGKGHLHWRNCENQPVLDFRNERRWDSGDVSPFPGHGVPFYDRSTSLPDRYLWITLDRSVW